MPTNSNNMLSNIADIFSNSGLIKTYTKKWKVIGTPRKFTEAELNHIVSCETYPGKFGLSICFHMDNDTASFITIDDKADIQLGDEVHAEDLQIKMIENVGMTNNPECPIGYRTLRIERIPTPNEPKEATDFNNPFGI